MSRGRPLSGVLEENIFRSSSCHYLVAQRKYEFCQTLSCVQDDCHVLTTCFTRMIHNGMQQRNDLTSSESSTMVEASTPRWPGRPVLWETLVSHHRGSLWVVRARALGEPLEGHKQQQHQRKHSASTNTLNIWKVHSYISDQRKTLRCCKTGSKVTHRVNHPGDQNKYS